MNSIIKLFIFNFLCLSLLEGQITNGQILHLPFNGTPLDISSSGLNGTPIGGPIYVTGFDNTPGGAIRLNGSNQAIDLPANSILRPSGVTVSFAFWINPSNLTSNWDPIFNLDQTPVVWNGYWCAATDTWLAFYFGDGGLAGPASRQTGSINYSLPLNTWTHVVGIIRGPNDFDIYIDCVQQTVNYQGTGGGISWTGNNGSIGKGPDGNLIPNYKYFDGAIDEFRMWNRELLASEIQQLCTTTCTNDTVRLIENICEGDSILFNNRWRKSTGFYTSINNLPNGCDSISFLTLNSWPQINNTIIDTICAGQEYDFNGRILNSSGVYTDNSQSVYGCDSNYTLNLTVLTATDSIWISTSGNPCTNDTLTLTANGPASRIIWNTGDTARSIQVIRNGLYEITSSGSCGNKRTSYLLDNPCLISLGQPPKKLYVPTAFTPNRDGVNEIFLPRGNGIQEMHMTIYNRWGEIIFETKDLNKGWNGNSNGIPQPPGIYFYVINCVFQGYVFRQENGYVRLLK